MTRSTLRAASTHTGRAIRRPVGSPVGRPVARSRGWPGPAAWAASALAALLALPAGAVSLGTIDSFSGGVTAGWTGGGNNPNPPTGVASGGPAGAGDGFLRIGTSGAPGPGGRLVAISGALWAGDYSAAGITGITMDVNNLGATDLNLRLYFEGGGAPAYSLQAVQVPAGSGWVPVQFNVLGSALSGSATTTLASVADFRLFHNPLAGGPQGAPFVSASLGIDNVTAVPEPGAGLLMALGLAGLLAAPSMQRR